MDVPVELSRIVITELAGEQVIFLKEKDGPRSFPIMIGINEAIAIDRRLKGKEMPRPMTHDLMATIIEALGGKLERIVIGDLQDHTFIATLHIRRGGEIIQIDSRPSDAIALGVAFDTPIFVAKHVLDEVTGVPGTVEDRMQLLRDRMGMLRERIAESTERLEDDDFLVQAPSEVLQQLRRQLDEMKTEYDAIDRVLKKLG